MKFQTRRISPTIRAVRNTTIILHRDENDKQSWAVEGVPQNGPRMQGASLLVTSFLRNSEMANKHCLQLWFGRVKSVSHQLMVFLQSNVLTSCRKLRFIPCESGLVWQNFAFSKKKTFYLVTRCYMRFFFFRSTFRDWNWEQNFTINLERRKLGLVVISWFKRK